MEDKRSWLIWNQARWRVSFGEDAPNVSLKVFMEELGKEIPKYNVPIDIAIENVRGLDDEVEQKIVFRHKKSTYKIFPTTIGFKTLGNFVFATQQDCVLEPPTKPESKYEDVPEIPRRSYLGVAISALLGFVLMAAGGIGILAGLAAWAISGYLVFSFSGNQKEGQIAKKKALEHNQARDRDINNWLQLFRDYQRTYKQWADDIDPEMFMLRDALNVIVGQVLQRLYPKANVGDPEKTVRKDAIEKQLADQMKAFDTSSLGNPIPS